MYSKVMTLWEELRNSRSFLARAIVGLTYAVIVIQLFVISLIYVNTFLYFYTKDMQ